MSILQGGWLNSLYDAIASGQFNPEDPYGLGAAAQPMTAQAQTAAPPADLLAALMAPQAPPQPAPQTPGMFTLNPNDPASWAAFRNLAGGQSAALNNLPNTLADTSTLLGRTGNDIYAQFYGQSPIAKARNLGMGA